MWSHQRLAFNLNGHTYIDPKRYLYTAVRNQALKHLAHERVVRNSHEMVQGEGRASAISQSPEGAEADVETAELEALRNHHRFAAGRCREAFELYRCNGMTCPEIADIMNISARTAETQVGHHGGRCARFLPIGPHSRFVTARFDIRAIRRWTAFCGDAGSVQARQTEQGSGASLIILQ